MPSIPLRDDYDAAQLRALARRSRDVRQTRRLLALAAVYDGMSREEAAKVGGMDRQTLRDWAHRFNAEGPEGLTNRAAPGRQRRLTAAQMEALAEIVETGPDPKVDGGALAAHRSEAGDRGALRRHLQRARHLRSAGTPRLLCSS
jgi:transposase